jgi:hypothetical protein
MHAVIRRYEGVDDSRTDEMMERAKQELIPRLAEISGFDGYYLLTEDRQTIVSVGLFETPTGAEESTRVAAAFIREANLEDVIPNPPQVITGEVVAHKTNVAALA